jgi:hypothetical protein
VTTKISWTADAFRTRRYEGPHRFTQKRPRTFVSSLQGFAAGGMSKNRLSRDFRGRSNFDFFNSIRGKADIPPGRRRNPDLSQVIARPSRCCQRILLITFISVSLRGRGATESSCGIFVVDLDSHCHDYGSILEELLSKFGLQVDREDLMDEVTRCTKCGKQTFPVFTLSGRTELQCICCDDPAVKLAQSPATAPDEPIVVKRAERVRAA